MIGSSFLLSALFSLWCLAGATFAEPHRQHCLHFSARFSRDFFHFSFPHLSASASRSGSRRGCFSVSELPFRLFFTRFQCQFKRVHFRRASLCAAIAVSNRFFLILLLTTFLRFLLRLDDTFLLLYRQIPPGLASADVFAFTNLAISFL